MQRFNSVKVERLVNGLTLVTVPMPGVASVAVTALVEVGSRFENAHNMGLAHFYEHLAVMGTEKYPTNFEFTKQIEDVGADFNAFTAEEYTGFYVKTESRHLEMALEMLSQLVIHPLLAESEIERERLVIMEEINMREDTPQIKVADRMQELLFAGSGLGLPGTGSKESVGGLVKRDFTELKERFYKATNTVLVIAGNIEGEEDGLNEKDGKTEIQNLSFRKATRIQRGTQEGSREGIPSLVEKYFRDLVTGKGCEAEIYKKQNNGPWIEVIKKQT